LIVNPHDITDMAEALERALTMSLPHRQARHQENIEVLRKNNLGVWRESFLRDLRACRIAQLVEDVDTRLSISA